MSKVSKQVWTNLNLLRRLNGEDDFDFIMDSQDVINYLLKEHSFYVSILPEEDFNNWVGYFFVESSDEGMVSGTKRFKGPYNEVVELVLLETINIISNYYEQEVKDES